MPFVGPPLVVNVRSPSGLLTGSAAGSMVTLWNRSGSPRTITVGDQVVTLHGNTTAGLWVDLPQSEVVVFDGDEQVWPTPPLDSPA